MGYQNVIDFLKDTAGNKYTYMVVYPTEGGGQRSLKVIDKNDSLECIRAFIKAYDSESRRMRRGTHKKVRMTGKKRSRKRKARVPLRIFFPFFAG
jgi:hypothetical protein